MSPILDRLFVVAIFGGLGAWVVWGWTSWARNRPRTLNPGKISSVVGFVCASLSTTLQMGTGLYAQFIGGFSFLDPTLLRIYRAGLIWAVLGFFCGVFGSDEQTPLRFKTPALSAALSLLWIMQIISE